MRRPPIRWRVTLAFAGALLVTLTAIGAFVYLRLEVELDRTLDRGLQVRAGEVSAIVRRSPEGLASPSDSPFEADESVAQVLRNDGSVVTATAQADRTLLTNRQLRAARSGPLFADRAGSGRLDEAIRVLAVPVRARGESYIVVVGSSLDEKYEALSSLLTLELIGLGIAAFVASAVGYRVAGIALRPVEAMRRQAEQITHQPDKRLPVPPVDDELGRLGVTLNAMLERLERSQVAERSAIANERRLVADASHELRTPLTILKSQIEVALLGERDVDALDSALRSAGEETDRLVRLTEELLVLAQADEGRLAIHVEPFDVRDLLKEVADQQRMRASLGERRILAQAPVGLMVCADRVRLRQALVNLVVNALNHGRGDIQLTARRDHDAVRVAVRDHGPGFGANFAEHAFERFSREDPGRAGGGAGLGLAIVRAVAEAHGAVVELGNADPGARVEIVLVSP